MSIHRNGKAHSLFEREDVARHFRRINLGNLWMWWHVPWPTATSALSHHVGHNRNGLRVASVLGGDIDVRRAGLGFVIRVADVALVLL